MAHKYGSLFNIKVFKEEVDRNYKGVSLSDEDIYKIAKKVYINELKAGNYPSTIPLRNFLRRYSEKVFNDRAAWESDIPEELRNSYIKEFCFKVPPAQIYKAFWYKPLADAFKKHHVQDDIEAYDVAKSVLFELLQSDYKYCDKIRVIVQNYAVALEGDKDAWKKDYEAFLKDKVITIRKAARGGKYEEIQLTASEVLDMKRRDEQLEDVDEDL